MDDKNLDQLIDALLAQSKHFLHEEKSAETQKQMKSGKKKNSAIVSRPRVGKNRRNYGES